MTELPKKYNIKETEKKWQDYWFENKIYAWDESEARENTYVIDTPPPTVSGQLHMGHIFSYTQADFIARYQRMQGKTVFYPMGFDDNGLPTERLVEKISKKRGHNTPRKEFIEICKEVVKDAEDAFRDLFKSTALSVDWSQEYQTISEQSRLISQSSFIDLFEKGQISRKNEPVLWDVTDRTALAQADIEDKELDSTMNDITFVLENGEELLIATTRPELLPACVAVMYHPEDPNSKKYKNQHAITPIFGVKVPMIADELVDREKGTGLVMCCTFGDQTDVLWWKKHSLPLRIVLDEGGIINSDLKGAEELNGLYVKKAQKRILELLQERGTLKNQEAIKHTVKCAERSGTPLEIIVTEQWFVNIKDKKEELFKKANECNWYPSFMKQRIESWIDGLNWDWCISRQRYFGVPFPVWHTEDGKTIIAKPKDLPIDPIEIFPENYGYKNIIKKDEHFEATEESSGNIVKILPDKDVMDTWATSSVSPQLSSHGISKEINEKTSGLNPSRHSKLFPADLRPQAHEIIRSWAFYTIVKAHLHEDNIPWQNLMISGWCLASDKTKMSKSKGNVITPVELIRERGADTVRYWASTSKLGSDTAFSEDVLKIGKKLVTKLWNATKFGAIHFSNLKNKPTNAANDIKNGVISGDIDLWIISKLNKAIAKYQKEFEAYEYSNARSAVEDFFWNDFCDNYLEIVKKRAYNEDGLEDEGQQSCITAIYYSIEAVLKLFAPFVPHITEELYSHIFADRFANINSIHARGTLPKPNEYPENENAEKAGKLTVEILNEVRKIKAENNVSLKYEVEELCIFKKNGNTILENSISDLQNVTNSRNIVFKESDELKVSAVLKENEQG